MFSRPSQRRLLSLVRVTATVFVFSSATFVCGQTRPFCEGELGDADWVCEYIEPVSPGTYEEFYELPGTPDPLNPARYKQIAGDPAFDEDTGLRNDNAAVFVLTEGVFFCMVAESNGVAALFDAPEGNFVSSVTQYPTSSWLPESVKALLADDTKLKYIVYTHAHWDQIGAAGLVTDYFAADKPTAISSRHPRWTVTKKNKRDPDTAFGNNRGVPVPEWFQEDVLQVGHLRFDVDRVDIHQTGDYLIYLNKDRPKNANEGIVTSVVMVTDAIFPGWSPFFAMHMTQDIQGYLEGLDQVNDVDFDVLVGGHLTRLGTKADVQVKVDFFADILAGSELGHATVTYYDVGVGIGVVDPTHPLTGHTWLFLNEYLERVIDICYDYVVDSSARGRNWLTELNGVDVTLRSHCWAMGSFVRLG